MLEGINIHNILFLDIETVSGVPKYSELPERVKTLWDHKASFLKKEESDTKESLYCRAGIYAEFGKIICISVGYVHKVDGVEKVRLKSFASHDEVELLKNFSNLLNEHFGKTKHLLCGHNAKEFDFPYICRRLLINELPIPNTLNIAGKKPWEVNHLDTMQLWRFGDYKAYTSLDLLTAVFNVPSPKSDISGADVSRVYWEDNDLERIAEYCQQDVVALIQIFRKYQGLSLIDPSDILMS
jgi:DNA polymerase elongation subunit (family B)